VTETIEETVDYLLKKGEKVGVIKVHLYRPFSAKHFFEVLPKQSRRSPFSIELRSRISG
jgi:pyruvate-ferredoxin/flavodoxin oxidoreductase